MNNYKFWQEYLLHIKDRINHLKNNKRNIYMDMHIHSDYSADGTQSLGEIINRSQDLGLDVIAITDHDSIKIYDELYGYICTYGRDTNPIIVPGVEFTVEYEEYGGQCHILQLMINPKEKEINNNINHNDKAAWNRVSIQFDRIAKNEAIQYFLKLKNIECTIENYKKFLAQYKRPIPEYSTLADYLTNILNENDISVLDLFDKLEETNVSDTCGIRRQMKDKRYKVLREKYKDRDDAYKSSRLLLSLVAVKGVDDDYFKDYESCGSLSVNKYGELKIEELNKEHLTIFAHPNEDKLYIMNKLKNINDNISGMEYNKQSIYSNDRIFFEKADKCNLIIVRGSDSHTVDSKWYEYKDFYKATDEEISGLLNKLESYIC